MGCKKDTEQLSATGKVAIVTGANTGIGLETAKELNLRGAKVYMLCRNQQRADVARNKLIEAGCDASRLLFSQCDLSSFASVRASAARMAEAESHVDILINNAALMLHPQFELTEDGHEMTWQCNHLGPFLLTELLLPLLKNAKEGRIVFVASQLHKQTGPLDLTKINDESSYGKLAPYNRSKLANVMYVRHLARLLNEIGVSNVTANSLHPGVVATDLHRSFPFVAKPFMAFAELFMKSERDGAQTSLYLAMSSAVKGVSGGYFDDSARAKENPAALDDEACKKLFEYCKKAVGLE